MNKTLTPRGARILWDAAHGAYEPNIFIAFSYMKNLPVDLSTMEAGKMDRQDVAGFLRHMADMIEADL